MRLFLAFRVFFIVLFRRDVASEMRSLLDEKTSPSNSSGTPKLSLQEEAKAPASKPTAAAPAAVSSKSGRRSDALTLLNTLQRESRLLDLVCESLDQYNDAQIGAAARDVLRDTRKTLDRMFGLKHLVQSPEGESVDIPSNASPVRWRIVGNESSRKGTLSHPGWQATKLDMPQWSGNSDDSMVIAAAEVET